MAPRWKAIRLKILRQAVGLNGIVRLATRAVDYYLQHKIALNYLYRPCPDDIFIVSFPKSGTSLMQMMLYQLATDGNMDFPHIENVSPWFELDLHSGLEKFIEELPSPRILKSHLTYGFMPRGVRSIYIAREIRDIAVSAFHHSCLLRGYELDFEAYVDRFLRGKIFGSWFKHIKSWWPHRNDPNVLFLRYEEIIADLPGTARRVAGFCGLPLDEEKMARTVERCSFPFMKQHDAKFDPRLRQSGRSAGRFIRSGVAGEGRKLLTAAHEKQLARRLTALARDLGCSPGEPYYEILIAKGARAGKPAASASSSPPVI